MLRSFFGLDQNPAATAPVATSIAPAGPFSDWKNALSTLGMGLLAKGSNPDADLFGTVLPMAQKMADARRQQDLIGKLAQDFQNSPALKDPQTKALVADLVGAGMIDKAYEIVKQKAPISVAAGTSLVDPATYQPVYTAPEKITKTDLEKNLMAAGIDPLSDQGKKIITDYYSKIGGRGLGGVRGQLWDQFLNQVTSDNPDMTPSQLRQMADAHISGETTLPDGTPVKPLTPLARERLNAALTGGTTSALITQGVKANQGEAEINVLKHFAQAGLKKFGTTYGGYSPAQIAATLSSDTKAARDLGKFVASQQLQFEIAQNQIKLAQGEPGVTTTQELMNLGMQHINAQYPKMSYQARKEAQDYFTRALGYGLKARNRVGIGAGAATGKSGMTPEQKKIYQDADEAIAAGADPEAVYQRIDELLDKKS